MNLLEQFGLNEEQTLLLFSLQAYLISEDINAEENISIKKKKRSWFSHWEHAVGDILEETVGNRYIIKDESILKDRCKELLKESSNMKVPIHLILLELSLFEPYFPIGNLNWKFYERVSYSDSNAENTLWRITKFLELDYELTTVYKKTFKKSIRSLSGFYKKMLIGAGTGTLLFAITAGFAAPYLATLAAPATLSGAAAVNAGLAALGGGAIVAGGFGMAGGMAVIVGGGSIFGAMSGTALGALLSKSSDFALLESAKLEVVMREIILISQKDIRFTQEMINGQQSIILDLEFQLSELKFNEKENKEQINKLAKAIDYLRSSLKNSQGALTTYTKNNESDDNGDKND